METAVNPTQQSHPLFRLKHQPQQHRPAALPRPVRHCHRCATMLTGTPLLTASKDGYEAQIKTTVPCAETSVQQMSACQPSPQFSIIRQTVRRYTKFHTPSIRPPLRPKFGIWCSTGTTANPHNEQDHEQIQLDRLRLANRFRHTYCLPVFLSRLKTQKSQPA